MKRVAVPQKFFVGTGRARLGVTTPGAHLEHELLAAHRPGHTFDDQASARSCPGLSARLGLVRSFLQKD